ncbi:MAG: ABC-type transport auxiliary lipoprotein family protein [Planctomycetota bacterium]
MRRVALACAALLLTGCLLGGGAEAPVERLYFLGAPPSSGPEPGPAAAPRGPERVWVEPFDADALLAQDGLVWRRGAVEAGVYADQRWARLPEVAARELVTAALRSAGVRAASEPPPATPDLVLRAHLARCEVVTGEDRWAGRVELNVALARPDGTELLRRVLRREEPAALRNPLAAAAALQRALAELSGELAREVSAALERARAAAGRSLPARSTREGGR